MTGTVADIRSYLQSAAVYVVPVRIGGGTRLKIFEALAMGKAVVSTTVGAEGLPLEPEPAGRRYYLKHMSVLLDIFILLDTVRIILRGGLAARQKKETLDSEALARCALLNEKA